MFFSNEFFTVGGYYKKKNIIKSEKSSKFWGFGVLGTKRTLMNY